MFRSLQWGSFLPYALFAVLALLGTTALAAAAPSIGVIDYVKLYHGYAAFKTAEDRYTAFCDEKKEPLEALREGIGLAPDEMKTFQDLHRLGKKNRTADQEKQFTDLKAKANGNYSSFQALAEKKKSDKLLDDDAKKLDALAPLVEPIFKQYDTLAQQVDEQIKKEEQRLQLVLTTQIDETVGKVAKTQKLTLVLNKDVAGAQGETEKIVIWNDDSLDISDKVLALLNDNFKLHPAIFDATEAK